MQELHKLAQSVGYLVASIGCDDNFSPQADMEEKTTNIK
jgi:hypothetical protein